MTERSINEIAALATKVRVTLSNERYIARKSGAHIDVYSDLLQLFSDAEICRFHDLIVSCETVDLEAYNNQRENNTR